VYMSRSFFANLCALRGLCVDLPRFAQARRFISFTFCILLVAAVPICSAAPRSHEPRMSFLDNGTIRVGVDLNLGGAITWLSRSADRENVINSYDWGRQVQMSYYGGPIPFVPPGKQVAPYWKGLGWNPIQSGDDFGHASSVLESSNDGRQIYVKCIPMQWPLDDVPGECTFECWLTLDGSTVCVRSRLANARSDHTPYGARDQELPAVYTNAPYSRIVSYTGKQPFAGEPVADVEAKQPPNWNRWFATEHWAALVDKQGWGLGVCNPGCLRFIGGFAGKPGEGDASSANCGYLAPSREEILDHNVVHEYRYELILGTINEIRERATKGGPVLPSWRFAESRDGWNFRNASDAGWPLSGEWEVKFEKGDPQILSPLFCRPVEEIPSVMIEAAFTTQESQAQLFWSTYDENGFTQERSIFFPIQNDGSHHEYRIKLSDSPTYRGSIIQLRLDPANSSAGTIQLKSIRFIKE